MFAHLIYAAGTLLVFWLSIPSAVLASKHLQVSTRGVTGTSYRTQVARNHRVDILLLSVASTIMMIALVAGVCFIGMATVEAESPTVALPLLWVVGIFVSLLGSWFTSNAIDDSRLEPVKKA